MELTKLWQVYPKISEADKKLLGDYSDIISQLLFNRGIKDRVAAKIFFSADWQIESPDPFLFKDMKLAVELIVKHVKANNKIAVVGDYDADGVTSSAVLKRVLTAIKGNVDVWIPNRLGEGYGVSKKIIDNIVKSGAKLIITVDNGIRAKAEVAYAKTKGIDVIVTDHHMGPDDLTDYPDAVIINPILPQENYPFKYLAGVGVAFKLMSALIKTSTLNEQQKERLLSQVLDLVAIGTVADCVLLLDENRLLVRQGLIELNRQLKPGIRSLVNSAGLKEEISEWSIGWQLAPRLNVAGRLEHANTSYELLVTDDQAEADKLALNLNNQNSTRQFETARIVEYAEHVVEAGLKNDKIIILTSPDLSGIDDKWLEGVIGLVAGRICEKYGRPTLVICKSEGVIKGSGRSIESVNIVQFLDNFQEHLARYGGHKMACGFTVKNKESLDNFVSQAREFAENNFKIDDLIPRLKIDMVLDQNQLTGALADQIIKLAPFGQGNPIPVFVTYGVKVMDLMPMGSESQHWKMRFGSIWSIAFSGAKKWPDLQPGETVDIVYTLEWNKYNGYKNLQLKIIDLVYGKKD
ncbi:MAG: single-stranded-DNA-specific exonuclease RecJ [Patescibacteria group bacterium]|nr:single-stranded-DNA-specific exonuclease RecJ [Patescibacteria group bacterium]